MLNLDESYFAQESERLRMRRLTQKDIPNWVAFFEKNDHLEYLGMDLKKSKKVLSKEWIEAQLARYKSQGLGHLAIELKSNGAFIGMAGILPRIVQEQQEYEIAYSLKPPYWGKGYATEVAQMMKNFGIISIDTHRFISIIHVDNAGSMNVARKNGMDILFKTEYFGMPVNVFGLKNDNQL